MIECNILLTTSIPTVVECLEKVTHGCSVKDCSGKSQINRKIVHVISVFC